MRAVGVSGIAAGLILAAVVEGQSGAPATIRRRRHPAGAFAGNRRASA